VTGNISPKTTRGHKAIMATTSGMAKKAASASVTGAGRISANGGSEKDKYSGSKRTERIERGTAKEGSLYNRSR